MTRRPVFVFHGLRFLLPVLLCCGMVSLAQDEALTEPGRVLHLRIAAAIGPATADYILDGIQTAAEGDYRAVVLEMDTPGGLDSAMRDIIKGILASPVPVITWVSPGGSRAASAGTSRTRTGTMPCRATTTG